MTRSVEPIRLIASRALVQLVLQYRTPLVLSQQPHQKACTVDDESADGHSVSVLHHRGDVGFLWDMATGKWRKSLGCMLPNKEKIKLLDEFYSPPSHSDFVFPAKHFAERRIHFQSSLLHDKYPWLSYSPAVNGGFCLPCALFAPEDSSKDQLTNCPSTDFAHGADNLKYHEFEST